MTPYPRACWRSTIAAYLALALPAHASEKINYPQVVEGRLQYEYLGFGDFEMNNGDDRTRHRIQVNYGITDRIDLAISGSAEDHSSESLQITGPSARARLEVTTQGDWWLSSGVQARYFRTTDGNPDAVALRGLLMREEPDWFSAVNFGLVRQIGAGRQESMNATLAAQFVYRMLPEISPGVEYYTSLGRLNDLEYGSRQAHEIGPIITGLVPVAADTNFGYVAGYYRGLSETAPEQSFKLQLNLIQQF